MSVGEVLGAGAQDVPGPIEGVVLAAAVAVGLLLHPAPHVIYDCGRQLHYMERVQDRAGVFELVIDGVLVPVERVQRRDLHPLPERLAAFGQPGRVHLPGPARHQVQQPGPHVAALVAGQVDHPGQFFWAPTAFVDGLGRHVMSMGQHPARGATHHLRGGLDGHGQRAAIVTVHPDHMQAAQAHEKVTTVAVATPGAAAQRRLGHRRGPWVQER